MWFVTVVQKVELNEFGLVEFGDHRTWGFFQDKELATSITESNAYDIHDGMYEYAVIEEYDEGIANNTGNTQWFKWDDNKAGYVKINEPLYARSVCRFAVG